MNIHQRLPVFITDSHPCSYLEGRKARTAFIDPGVVVTQNLACMLNQKGFRRSGRYLYRTSCLECQECKPLRILNADFKPNRSQKRTLRKNQDLESSLLTPENISPELSSEYYALYKSYIEKRHYEGDMYPPSREQFDSFIGELFDFSRIIEFRLQSNLVMVALCDIFEDGLSAIYTFFDPSVPKRSLGVYSVLWQIEYCRAHKLPFMYMGFWVRECDKMNYKASYNPHQIFHSGRWQHAEKPQYK